MSPEKPAFSLTVTAEELRQRSLFIAAPMYGGLCHGPYKNSMVALTKLLMEYGVKHMFSDLYGESLIPRGRNYLADEFLRSECTHMLFIDADITFTATDVLSLLAINKQVIGAPYCKKQIDWERVRATLKAHPDIPVEDLEKIAAGFVFNIVGGKGSLTITHPVQVMEIGTGYMMIRRDALDLWRQQYPEQSYMPDNRGSSYFSGDRPITAYFDCQIDRAKEVTSVIDGLTRKVGGSDRYLSEDYFFCQWWRNMGGEIWLCPWMESTHTGTYTFKGSLRTYAKYGITG